MSTDEDRDRRFDALLRQHWPPPAPNDSPSCIDAETLAAWSEGTLTRDVSRLVEAHAAGCARCQAMLAAFVRSGGADATPAEAPEPLWRRWQIRWLVPIAATATALAVWVAGPAERPAERPAAPARSAEMPATAEPQAAARAVDSKSIPPPAPASAPIVPPALRQEAFAPSQGQIAAAPQALEEARATADKVTPLEKPERETQAQIADAGVAGAATPAAPAPVAARSAGGLRADAFAAAQAGEIVSPDPERRWRIVAPGGVEYSTTGGREWRRASVLPANGAAPVLLAGSAPAPDICWVVGRAGVVLLSTDGVTFRRVASPAAGDLTAVRAQDGRRAVVTTADGRTLVTTDAGETWSTA